MRFGFVTCVQLGLSCMEAIYRIGGSLECVFTLHDDLEVKKSGRVFVDEFCANHSIDLVKVRNINDEEALSALRSAQLDWLFIIGWSQIAREPVLQSTQNGAIGMHPTLLPEGRGRAAIPWAILKQLPRTGVTMFKLDTGVDTGEILAQKVIPLPPRIDARELYELVDTAHVELIEHAFPRLVSDQLPLLPQDEALASLWPGRKPEDGRIDTEGSVHDAERLVRAVTHPYPGAFLDRGSDRLVIWKARVLDSSDTPQGVPIAFPDGLLDVLEYDLVARP